MNEEPAKVLLSSEKITRRSAIAVLVLLGVAAFAGPSGFLAWAENLSQLDQRKAEIATLEAQHKELSNRVALLNPAHADPDLVGELLRSKLNVAHPDEVVIVLKH